MTKQTRLFDKRVVERNLDKGLITQEDIAEYMQSLPDMESNSELLLLDADETEEAEEAEEAQPEDTSYNFDTPEEDGPKNVYDF
jgi:hypothetical protein